MRVFYMVSSAALVAIAALVGMNFLNNPIEERRTALARDLQSAEGTWRVPELNRGTSPEQHESTITGKPQVWRHIIERPKPKPEPFDIAGALRGVEGTRQALGDRVLIRTPGNARGAWFQVGDSINGVPIVEITREQITFSIRHTDGNTYTHTIGR